MSGRVQLHGLAACVALLVQPLIFVHLSFVHFNNRKVNQYELAGNDRVIYVASRMVMACSGVYVDQPPPPAGPLCMTIAPAIAMHRKDINIKRMYVSYIGYSYITTVVRS